MRDIRPIRWSYYFYNKKRVCNVIDHRSILLVEDKKNRNILSRVRDKVEAAMVWSSVIAAIYVTILVKRKKGFSSKDEKRNK